MLHVGLQIDDKRIAIYILGETGLLRVSRLPAAGVSNGAARRRAGARRSATSKRQPSAK
jgi:hypothetical protein